MNIDRRHMRGHSTSELLHSHVAETADARDGDPIAGFTFGLLEGLVDVDSSAGADARGARSSLFQQAAARKSVSSACWPKLPLTRWPSTVARRRVYPPPCAVSGDHPAGGVEHGTRSADRPPLRPLPRPLPESGPRCRAPSCLGMKVGCGFTGQSPRTACGCGCGGGTVRGDARRVLRRTRLGHREPRRSPTPAGPERAPTRPSSFSHGQP